MMWLPSPLIVIFTFCLSLFFHLLPRPYRYFRNRPVDVERFVRAIYSFDVASHASAPPHKPPAPVCFAQRISGQPKRIFGEFGEFYSKANS